MNRIPRSSWPCRHGVDGSLCPQCNEESHREWEAVELASRDPERVETLRRDFDAWVATDPQPAMEVANG